jgi:hypothetical protein
VAVPNVTAIDWKQADVTAPAYEHLGGMSFTVQEARAAFVVLPPLHVGGSQTDLPSISACPKNSERMRRPRPEGKLQV